MLPFLKQPLCRKTLPCSKGIETATQLSCLNASIRRKTLPCSKGIETHACEPVIVTVSEVGRHCPVPKGLRPTARHRSRPMPCVGRHCPVPKGLRRISYFLLICPLSRKTLPCSKGIETLLVASQPMLKCRKTLPCSKGIINLSLHSEVFFFVVAKS